MASFRMRGQLATAITVVVDFAHLTILASQLATRLTDSRNQIVRGNDFLRQKWNGARWKILDHVSDAQCDGNKLSAVKFCAAIIKLQLVVKWTP